MVNPISDAALALFRAAVLVLASALSSFTHTRPFSVSVPTLLVRVNRASGMIDVEADEVSVAAFEAGDLERIVNDGDEAVMT